MNESERPFRLDDDFDEDEDRARQAERAAREAQPAQAAEEPPDENGVDQRTFAEKHGTAVEVVAGRRPSPAGWPLEALTFPLRRPGPGLIVGGALVWALLDLVTLLPPVAFLGYLLKLVALPFFLRWQIHEASMSAAGRDEPVGWLRAMDMDREQVVGLGRLLLAAFLLSLPGLIVLLFLHQTGAGIGLLFAASLWASVGALGLAVGERGMLWPWRALEWLVRRPLGLVAGTAGWWAAGLAEVAVHALAGSGLGTALLVCVLVRLLVAYLWLVSARALGVVGRSWSPWQEDGGATSPRG